MTELQKTGLSTDTRALMTYEAGKKSVGLSYVLWLFFGGLGGHRYYNGRVGSGLGILALTVIGWLTLALGIGLILLVAAGIWVIVDAFLIPGWVSSHNMRLMASLDS